MIRRPPRSTLFPYPPLSRSHLEHALRDQKPAEHVHRGKPDRDRAEDRAEVDRKSTRLNSSHVRISYAVFCLRKKMFNDLYVRNHESSYCTVRTLRVRLGLY